MFNSLRSRLWFTYALVIGVALGIVGIVFVLYFAKNPVQSLQARIRLQTAAETIFKRVSNIESIPLEQLQESIARADQAFDVRVLIYNQKTQLIIDSRQGEVPPLNLHIPLLRLKEGQQVSVLSKKDESGNGWLYLPKLIPNSMILVVATPQPAIGFWAALRSRGNDIFPTLRRAGLIALFFGLILAFWIAHWVSSPLQKMIQATKKISIGEYTDIPIEGPREVRSLANSFNEMAKKVRDSQQATRDFVANVSHDLKTPLTSIQGFAQALLDGTAGTPQAQKQAASVIFDEANHMHNMVLNLLDLARFDSGVITFRQDPIDCNALLNRVVKKFTPIADRASVSLKMNLAYIPTILGDDDRLAQAFGNLVDNAIKYSPSGSEVLITLKEVGDYIEISFQDSGIGIPPKDIPRVFERFYQADRSRQGGSQKGAGLGLAIAKEIISKHHGEIQVYSEPGQGSIFVVKLPIAKEEFRKDKK